MKCNKVIFLCALWCFFSCGTGKESQHSLTIATAANMQFVMPELVDAFTAKTQIKCQTIISSSGKLTAQIRESAPYDILVSANMKYPLELFENNLTASPPAVYAFGKLILWSKKKNSDLWAELASAKTKNIAIANPKIAPYGEAAVQVLHHLKLWKSVKGKLVYGESIAQTNQFITSKAADLGFTALSVIHSPRLTDKGNWIEIDTTWYPPIEQGIVVLNNRKEQISNAKKFQEFLFSPQGKSILNKFGYATK